MQAAADAAASNITLPTSYIPYVYLSILLNLEGVTLIRQFFHKIVHSLFYGWSKFTIKGLNESLLYCLFIYFIHTIHL